MRRVGMFFYLLFCLALVGVLHRSFGAESDKSHILFRNAAQEIGVTFQHVNGTTPDKYMPETMGSGAVIFDYNDDGWPDIFLVNAGSLVDADLAQKSRSALFRNNGDGTFRNITKESGIARAGFGMGACAGDYDNDGNVDLYLTNFGGNNLYKNTGHGAFTDVTDKAGVASSLWSTSCAFSDVNKDGYLDLFVVRYVDFALDNNKFCGNQAQNIHSYCHPNVYNGLSNVLFKNNGDGTFMDITKKGGLYTTAGKGMGVVFTDYDNDTWPDIFVANDSVPNFLFHNKQNGTFEETALWAGVAVASDGKPRAGMGTDFGDINNDGWFDAIVTNLDMQTHNLFRNLRGGIFGDVTYESGVGEATLPFVGFGTAFFDYDNDGDQDLVIANGDVLDNASVFRDTASYPQRNLLLRNDGKEKFTNVTSMSGPGFELMKVSRGLAVGDLDNDGDLDVLISNNGQTADVLRNDGGNRNNSIVVRTVGTSSNRDGIGAHLQITVGEQSQWREVRAGSSYESQNDMRVHFGLGQAARVDRLEIRWPSGTVDTISNIDANQFITVVEGKGITRRQPFSKRAVEKQD